LLTRLPGVEGVLKPVSKAGFCVYGVTEYLAMQGKGGCRLGDESSAQANSVRANGSAVRPCDHNHLQNIGTTAEVGTLGREDTGDR